MTGALVWTLVVQLVTGQMVTIDMASEEECRTALRRVKGGEQLTLMLRNGVTMPVAEAFDCVMRRKQPETPAGGGVL